MRLFGRDIRWSEEPLQTEERHITDIGLAFEVAQVQAEAGPPPVIPAIYRAVQIITDAIAALPLRSVGTDGITEPVTPDILLRPSLSETYNSTMRRIGASLLFRGNAYLYPTVRDTAGYPARIRVLNPDEVTVSWDRDQLFPVYQWRGRTLTANRDIFHIPINLWPGRLLGMGPIEAARTLTLGMRADMDQSRRLAEDNSTPGLVIQVPAKLTQTEAAEVREMWESAHKGRKRPAVISGGTTVQQVTLSPVDAQWIESRHFSVQEAARMFGLFGYFLLTEDGGSLTYTNPEALFRAFFALTLQPTYLEPIEQTFSLLLRPGSRARFDSDEILKADVGARYTAHEIGLRAGFLTVPEVREKEHLPRLEPSAARTTEEARP